MGAHSPRRLDGGRYHLVLATGFLVALGALGGASRGDEIEQPVVALISILAIAAALWPADPAFVRDVRGPAVAIALVYLLVLAQLLPLPASIWAAMPGHGLYATIAAQVGIEGWRPWSLNPDRTLNALAGLLPATAMCFLALSLDLRARVRIAHWVVGIACASAVLGLLQLGAGGTSLHLFRTSSVGSAVGLFANRNHQAVLMATTLPLVAALMTVRIRSARNPNRILSSGAAIAALLLMAIGATGSRMGLALGLLGLAAGIAIYLVNAGESAKALASDRRKLAAILALAAIAAVPVALLLGRSGAIARLSARQAIDDLRFAALEPMSEAVRAFFPFGAGFGTFDTVYRRFEPDSLLSTIYLNQAHNEPVQLAIEGGIFALLLLAIFLLWWFRSALRAIAPRPSAERRAMGMAAVATTFVLMLSSLVDYPLRTPLLGTIFVLACVEMLRGARRGSRRHSNVHDEQAVVPA